MVIAVGLPDSLFSKEQAAAKASANEVMQQRRVPYCGQFGVRAVDIGVNASTRVAEFVLSFLIILAIKHALPGDRWRRTWLLRHSKSETKPGAPRSIRHIFSGPT